MRPPNLNALRIFEAAGRHLNFRIAAEELHLTQGAVAQQVRRLEADLGLALFERHARGLAFTEVGRRYHAPVRRALAIIGDATRTLTPQSTQVTLSVTPSFASKWLVPRLGAFSDAYPDIEVRIVASEGLANFRSDGVDVAIRQGRAPLEDDLTNDGLVDDGLRDGLRITRLAPLELCAVCSGAMAQTVAPIRRLADFTTQPLLQDSHNLWDALFGEAGLRTPRRMTRFNQTALAIDAAVNHQGIALAPRLFVDAEIARGRLVELWRDGRPDQGGFYVVYPETQAPLPARDSLVDWILSDLPRGGVANDPTPKTHR